MATADPPPRPDPPSGPTPVELAVEREEIRAVLRDVERGLDRLVTAFGGDSGDPADTLRRIAAGSRRLVLIGAALIGALGVAAGVAIGWILH